MFFFCFSFFPLTLFLYFRLEKKIKIYIIFMEFFFGSTKLGIFLLLFVFFLPTSQSCWGRKKRLNGILILYIRTDEKLGLKKKKKLGNVFTILLISFEIYCRCRFSSSFLFFLDTCIILCVCVLLCFVLHKLNLESMLLKSGTTWILFVYLIQTTTTEKELKAFISFG